MRKLGYVLVILGFIVLYFAWDVNFKYGSVSADNLFTIADVIELVGFYIVFHVKGYSNQRREG